jgi:osmotically-inducible protein OsmY
VVTTKVKTAILNDADLKVLQINVETFKGVVQLSGFVDSKAMMARAVEVTRGVAGVVSVKDDMRLR